MSDLEKLKQKLYITNDFGVTYQDPDAKLTDKEIEDIAKTENIRTDVHRMCVNCQLRQLIKYKGRKSKDPETGETIVETDFRVSCKFVPKNMPAELVEKYHQLVADGRDPEIARKILMATVDAVEWAELMFGFDDKNPKWYLRSYQKEQIRCSGQRMVVREGRRCVSKETPILMADGTWKPIYKIRPGDIVVTNDDGSPSTNTVNYLFDNGIQEVWELIVDSGQRLVMTKNHPVLVYRANRAYYVDIDNGLKVGDIVALYRSNTWSEFGFGKIVSLSSMGYRATYDLEVLSHHSFIANGIVTANSGKTMAMAVKLLHTIFNRKIDKGYSADGEKIEAGPEILIVTPYQSQLTTIFNEMESLLKRNPDLASMVIKSSGSSLYTKTPHYKMVFTNGARVNGFVSGAGVKSDGSAGGTIRSATAQVIYLDEMDLIPTDVIEKVIKPILLSDIDGEVTLLATSTPIGKRSFFFDWCKNSPDFKEDHLPSTVLPQWNRVKKILLADSTKEGIMTEYMAEFIDSEFGVFKPTYVYRAKRAYTYKDISDPLWWREVAGVNPASPEIIRCIGIDWNKNAGTEFVVVAYIPQTHTYLLLDAINISSGETSGLKWKETVISLNIKWKPDFIYADEGYGHTLIEDLHVYATGLMSKKVKTAYDKETIKLRDKLKSLYFSGKIELRNPADNITFEKPVKEFLVENAQRLFEDNGSTGAGIIWMPEDEDILIKQLLNYIIVRLHLSTGKPIYGCSNDKIGDHRLDAFMLAVGGIAIETGLYGLNNLAMSDIQLSDFNLSEERAGDTIEEVSPFTIIREKLRNRKTGTRSRKNIDSGDTSPLSYFDNVPKQKQNYNPDDDYRKDGKRNPRGKYRRSF